MTSLDRLLPLAPLVLIAIAVRIVPQSWAVAEALFLVGATAFILLEWRGRREPAGFTPVVGAGLGAIVLGALAMGWAGQPPVGLNGGLGWDGISYHAIYDFFRDGSRDPRAPAFPYHQRIGLPFLANLLPLPDRTAFLTLHALFWMGAMAAYYAVCRRVFGIRREQTLLSVLWLQVHWLSVTRGLVSYAYNVDSAAIFFTTLLVAIVASGRWMPLLIPLGFVASLFKESAALWLGLTAMALALEHRSRPPATGTPPLLWPVLGTAAAVAGQAWAASFFPEVLGSSFETIRQWAAVRSSDPTELIRYPACILSALGGAALLTAAWRFEHPHGSPASRPALWWLLAGYFAVCFVAGSDLTRFAWLAFPLALPLLMQASADAPPRLAVPAFLLGLPAAYPFALIATPEGRGIPLQDYAGPYSWMLEYAHLALVAVWLAWFGLAWVILRALIRGSARSAPVA